MPDNLDFRYGANWEVDEGNSLVRIADNLSDGDFKNLFGALGSELKTLLRIGTQGVAGKRLLQTRRGTDINPNLELLYSNPSMRSFSWNWTFAFKRKSEVDQFKQFEQVMLEAMHPDFVDTLNGVWRIPATFEIEFINAKTRKIKPCVLTAFNINDTASGAGWKAFVDGEPAFVQVQAVFNEIEPLVRQNIREGF
jgi:hypothetical protein